MMRPGASRLAERRLWMPAAFLLFFAITLLLYYPTVRAGWMRDTIGWLSTIRRKSFWEYINIPHHGGSNYYQLTQTVTWLLYQAFGTSRFAWFLVHTSAFALTAALLYRVAQRIFEDARVTHGNLIALGGALLFCTSPYATEPVVWKAAWHFLQALLIIFLILDLLLRFIHTGKAWMAVCVVALFAISTASLELFYLTPLYGTCVLLFYRYALGWDRAAIRRAWTWIGAPLMIILALHFLRMGAGVKGVAAQEASELGASALAHYAVVPPLYALRLLWGRFLPENWQWNYHMAMCSYVAAGLFYGMLGGVYAWILLRFRRFAPDGKVAALVAVMLALSMLLVLPLWFPEHFLIVCDRYAYILLPPFYMLLAIALGRMRATTGRVLACCLLALNVGLTSYLSSLWSKSNDVIEALQTHHPPVDTTRVTILLNNPASLHGAAMFGADISEEWRSMHNQLYGGRITHTMPEIAAYNMNSIHDGAHVQVLDDSTLTVRLNQPGYWTYGFGFDTAAHHTSLYYTMERQDQQTYWLRLHRSQHAYVLWYQQGDRYKVVDMALRSQAQW